MRRNVLALCFAIVVLAGQVAGAAPAAPVAQAAPVAPAAPISSGRTSLGIDLGATAAGAFVGAVAVTASLEVPLSRAWALDIEPSFYAGSGSGEAILQVNAEALARFYVMSLFVGDANRTMQWGPFVAAGAVAAWENAQGDAGVAALAVGPAVRVGYRLVFGDAGFFLEPSLGFMALLGGRFEPGGSSAGINSGFTFGMIAGWRF